MFKKLRNRFLLLNMIMISVLLIASFVVVFMMTYTNTNNAVIMQLNRGIGNFPSKQQKFFGSNFDSKITGDFQDDKKNFVDNNHNQAHENEPPGPNEAIVVKFDGDGNIIEKRSPYNYEDDFYNTIISDCLAKLNKKAGSENQDIIHNLKYDDRNWKYLVRSSVAENTDGDVQTVYFLSITDISTQIGMLQRLILTLVIVLFIALIIVFLICLYFANKSIKPIEEAWNKQNQFIADASHELKTPLTTINTNVDVLLTHGDDKIKDEKKWLMYIKDESTRMAKLTNDLLYLAKVDYGSEKNIIRSEFSFSSAVQSVLLTIEAVIYEKNLILNENIEDNINIVGDNAQIKQLILILIDNAIKYTNHGGTIDVTLKKNEKNIEFSVRNTGDGISSDDLEKIFDRFYRSDKSRARNSGGYGLGLAIAKSIAASYNGTIKVKSKASKYTEFIVNITT